VDVGRLIWLVTVEIESIRAGPEHRRHAPDCSSSAGAPQSLAVFERWDLDRRPGDPRLAIFETWDIPKLRWVRLRLSRQRFGGAEKGRCLRAESHVCKLGRRGAPKPHPFAGLFGKSPFIKIKTSTPSTTLRAGSLAKYARRMGRWGTRSKWDIQIVYGFTGGFSRSQ
jgi:hypothetical protein